MKTYQNTALGDFLRDRRERLNPDALGLPTMRRRRTSGLRREEVAERAGIGVDWYVRLEQGRAVSPSPTTIDALAAALCLNEIEHDHLRALAHNPAARPFERETVPERLQAFVSGLREPAYVTGQRWDVLFWNEAAASDLIDFGAIPECDRNILRFMFLNPSARPLFDGAWETTARRMVALFRKTYDLWATDKSFRTLATALLDNSADFARWWRAHDIERGDTSTKTIHHEGSAKSYICGTLQIADNPALRLAIYSPV